MKDGSQACDWLGEVKPTGKKKKKKKKKKKRKKKRKVRRPVS